MVLWVADLYRAYGSRNGTFGKSHFAEGVKPANKFAQLEFSLGMFHTTLQEIAGNTTANGKKATSNGNSNAIRNNFEFTKLLRDVEAELNSIRIGQKGKTKADRHPKMVKTLELVSWAIANVIQS